MESAVSSRSPWALAFAITLGFMVALVIGGADLYFKTPLHEKGDAGVNALQIENARHGTEIYGNYSRFEFNHPGPAFFYAYAAGEIVLKDWLGLVPAPHNAHLLASLLIQTACFALAVALVHCWIDSWTFVALALLGGVWHFSLARSAFTSIWPPHVLLMPFVCFVTAACSFSAGRKGDLALMVILGGLLFHGHVAQPLFVGGIGALAFFLHYRHLKATDSWTNGRTWLRANRGLIIFCVALVGLFLLPLFIDVVRWGERGNVSTIVRRIFLNTENSKGALQSLLYFLSFSTYADNQEAVFSTLTPASYRFFQDHLTIISAWVVFLLFPGLFAIWRMKKMPEPARLFLRSAYPVLGVVFLLCIVWGKMQAGPMYQFNGYFYFGVYYFAGLLSIGVVCSIPGRLLPVPVTAALCGVAGISASWLFRAPRLTPDESGAAIRRGVVAVLQRETSQRPKLLVFEHYAWPEAVSVALELQRRGIPFYVAPVWNFMFGRQHSINHLGAEPETAADIWWVAGPGPGGEDLGNNLQLFTQPAEVDPRNTEINFATRKNGFRYLIYGLSVGNLDYGWTNAPRLVLKFRPLPSVEDVRVEVEANIARRPESPLAQPAEVRFNGQLLGVVSATQHEQLSIRVPRDVWNAAPLALLELRFTKVTYHRSFSLPANDNWTAWALWGFHFKPAAAN